MKLIDILLEQEKSNPKIIVMAGGAGAGKSSLLSKLQLDGLPVVNPDKYVEDPQHPAHNNLSVGARLADEEAQELANSGRDFIWDTTASNPKKVQELKDKGYDIFMVMVYTHPMISYIANSKRVERKVPSSAVFSTWRNVYQLIKDYQDITGGNLAIHINDREGKYAKEVEEFNKAAQQGPQGIAKYLQAYNEENEVGGSTFRKPIDLTADQEAKFKQATIGITWDQEDYSEDKALKKAFVDSYQKTGNIPDREVLVKALQKHRTNAEKQQERENQVLTDIANMLFDSNFQKVLQHSTVDQIQQKIQNFLA